LSLPCEEQNKHNPPRMKYWEIIGDNLSKAGWSWGCVTALDCNGRTIFIAADAHRDGKRLVVRADEKRGSVRGSLRGAGTVKSSG
jgi:hypothetical protein